MPNYLLLLLLAAGSLTASGQHAGNDSVLMKLDKMKKDSNRVNSLLSHAKLIAPADPATARRYLNRAKAESIEIGYTTGHFNSLVELADLFHVTNEMDSAIALHQQALGVAVSQGDSLHIGMSLFNLSLGYRELGLFEKSVEYSLKGRRILDKFGSLSTLAQVNDAICQTYSLKNQPAEAAKYGELSLRQAREVKQDIFIASALVSLSQVYITLQRETEAKRMLVESLELGKKLGNPRVIAAGLSNLAEMERVKRNFPAMTGYVRQSLELARQTGSTDMECNALRGLAIGALMEKDYAKAREYATEAKGIAFRYNLILEQIGSTRLLSAIAYANGSPREGYELDDSSNTLLDTAMSQVLSKQSAELDKQYETEKKVNTISRLEAESQLQALSIRQKNLINYILIAAAAVLLLVVVLIYRNYMQKQKLQQQRIRELETENQLASAEAVLQGEERERTRLSRDLHDGLGGMLSGIRHSLASVTQSPALPANELNSITRSIDMLDSSITEMRRLAHNLMPDALIRFGLDTALKDFCSDINKSGAIEISYQSVGISGTDVAGNTSVTIYRIVQELVNNILKHAAAKTALVQVTRIPGKLTITVEDDGKGFDSNQAASGIGLENLKSRVSYLRGKMDIESIPGKGTSVYIIVDEA